MFLEKIKNNAGKISLFAFNVFLAIFGILFLKIKNDQKTIEQLRQPRTDEISLATNQCIAAASEIIQQNISEDRKQKIDSVANNPSQTIIQKPVTVQTVVPGKTTTTPSKAKTKTS
jgi:hypothetical protein